MSTEVRFNPDGSVIETIGQEAPEEANERVLQDQIRQAITSLIQGRETLRTIRSKTNSQITAGDTKEIARQLMETDKVLLAVLRLVGGHLESSDTGTQT